MILSPDDPKEARTYSAAELRKLPPQERTAILKRQAILAEDLYLHDHELTDFETFGENDLYVENFETEER